MYKIYNKAGRTLAGFHSNGGWKIGEVFPCSNNMATIFNTKAEAEQYITYMLEKSQEQAGRWGEWLEVATKFIKTLTVK